NRVQDISKIEKDSQDYDFDATALSEKATAELRAIGMDALTQGRVAVVSLAGGASSRWTQGAGVVKALNPFYKMSGKHRTFIEIHLAKSRRIQRLCGVPLPHIITTSYLTHTPIEAFLHREQQYGYSGPLLLSPGR